jgi:hypothetical protein
VQLLMADDFSARCAERFQNSYIGNMHRESKAASINNNSRVFGLTETASAIVPKPIVFLSACDAG